MQTIKFELQQLVCLLCALTELHNQWLCTIKKEGKFTKLVPVGCHDNELLGRVISRGAKHIHIHIRIPLLTQNLFTCESLSH
jgi:hypothetical protein